MARHFIFVLFRISSGNLYHMHLYVRRWPFQFVATIAKAWIVSVVFALIMVFACWIYQHFKFRNIQAFTIAAGHFDSWVSLKAFVATEYQFLMCVGTQNWLWP